MKEPPSDQYFFGVTESGQTGTLRMYDARDDLESAMARMDGDERKRFALGLQRALNVYITAAKFENPPKFKIPDYLKPIVEQPAPPRAP